VGGAHCQEQSVQREAEDLAVMKMDSQTLTTTLADCVGVAILADVACCIFIVCSEEG